MMWELVEAIAACRQIEKQLNGCAHVALGGGVLLNGFSNKDLAIMIYPHSNTELDHTTINERFTSLGVPLKEAGSDESCIIYKSKWNGKLIDVFILRKL